VENEAQPDTSSADARDVDDALVSRLKVIEDQPLDTRAEAYGELHEELRKALEGGDSPRA
jgi:hypothetical protein